MKNFSVQAQTLPYKSHTNLTLTVASCWSVIQALPDSKKTVNLCPFPAAGVPFDPSGTLSPHVAAAAR